MLKRDFLMRAGILVAVVLIIGLLAGFTGGYFLTPTVTTTKILTSTTTSPMTVTTVLPTTIYKTATTTSEVLKTVTETSLTTTTAYSTVTTTTTLTREVPPMITVNATLEVPIIVEWKTGEGMLNVSIKIFSHKMHWGVSTTCDINLTNVGDKTLREVLVLTLPYVGGKRSLGLDKPIIVEDLKPGESKTISYSFGTRGDEPHSLKFVVLILEVGEEA